MSAYLGDDLLTYDANIAKLKEAFVSLLPEIFNKGNQEQFTSLKENFPCVRASTQTNPGLLAQAKLKDQETLSNLNEVLEAFQFIESCFRSSLVNREESIVNRDEALAFTCYDVLHGQLLVINQALATHQSCVSAHSLLDDVRAKEFSAKVHYNLSKFRSTKESVYQENVQSQFSRFEDAKEAFNEAFRLFSGEAKKLALIRQRPYDVNMSKYAFLNDIMWKQTTRMVDPANDPCSIDEYFARQDLMWSDALQSLARVQDPLPQQPQRSGVEAPPTRPNKNRLFSSHNGALENLMKEITQELPKMRLEELKFSLKEIESRHKVVEDLSLDPDVTVPETEVLSESRKLMRSIVVKIESKTKDQKDSDEMRKQEASANLRALGTVALPNLTGFSDYLAWRKAQERLNTHVDEFKKAAVLLNTLKNADDKARCQGIYDFDELMSILKTKYSHQEKLVPALVSKLRKLPEPHTDEVMARNIDVILNVYSQLKSISNVAISRFDSTVVEDMVLKLTPRYQERYEDYIEDNKSNQQGFSVFRFGEDEGSEVQTVISGASREEDRAPVDTSDNSTVKRNMFLTFLKRTETKLANMAARKVNLSTSAGGSKVQKCFKCKVKPCKCKKAPASGAYAAQVANEDRACLACNAVNPHLNRARKPTKCLSACKTFRGMSVEERRKLANRLKVCHICLNGGHFAKDCTREYKCNNCKLAHNLLLCPTPRTPTPSAPPMEEADAHMASSDAAYLAVSGVKIHDQRLGERVMHTCLWDSGSTHNFILDSLASKLGYVGAPAVLHLSRVGLQATRVKTKRYFITLVNNSGKTYDVEAYGMPHIGHRDAVPPNILKCFAKMFKTSVSMINNRSGEIGLLMGIPHLNLHPTPLKTIGSLRLLSSKFGLPYMVIGALNPKSTQASCNFIDASIRDYITTDALGLNLAPKCSVCLKSPPCKSCKLLTQPVSFREQEEGKLIQESMEFDYEKKEVRVSYPFLKDPRKIFPPDQSNFKLASKLATNLKKSLIRDGLLEEYCENWDSMIQRGVIRELSDEEIESWESAGNPVNYCSHHAVLKDTKSTKCRIVTNSSLAHNGTSLNAILPKGPNSISNLLHVMLRFRSKPFLVVADLSKAYNSVKTSEMDLHLRRFLWFRLEDLSNPDAKLRVFGLCRMHFGDTPSGFYLESCKEEVGNYSRTVLKEPVLADKLISETYVDDILPVSDTVEEAQQIADALPVAFGALGFKLKEVTVVGPGVNVDKTDPEHLLGHLYHFDDDKFQIQFKANFSKKRRGKKEAPNLTSKCSLESIPVTKRSILSLLASQYDPLGLCSPFLVKFKIFLNYLHKCGMGWDDPIAGEDKSKALRLIREMIGASESSLKFNRCVKTQNSHLRRIVCFSDGSKDAFQTVIYGVFVGPNEEVHTSLLIAKNRITSERVPRSELCGIVAGCRLLLNLLEAVSEASEAEEIQFFSDSTCCMDWIKSYPLNDIYVVNRVLEIHKSVRLFKIPTHFLWIPSKWNLADKGTRSDCKFQYLSSDEWQKGPSWIKDVANSPAQLKHSFNMEGDENLAMACAVAIEPDPVKDNIWSNLLKTHNLKKVLRVWCLVKDVFVKKSFKSKRSLTIKDMDRAFKFFVKLSQEEKPVEELKTKQLVMFKEDDILWTKMRFPDESLKKVFKKTQLPVLSSKSRFGKILLRNAHAEKMFRSIHAGIHQTLVNSRVGPFGAYITHAKQSIRGIVAQCVVCRKTALKTQDAKMGPRCGGFGEIPKDNSAFNRLAIDYFGPFLAKPPRGRETRGTKFFKIWGMAVLCQQTRAIKVYPIEGYDTQSFLTIFKTHCALHGVPTSVLSDPMSAFKAASKEVSSTEYDTNSLLLQLEEQFNLEWTFIPPGSQWRDPAERAIKSIKQMMDSVFSCEKGKPVLTLNEYWCLFSEISEMLNRRPIQGAVFEGSLRMICPNDLILGRTSKDQPSTLPESMDNRKRLQLIQDYKSEFWKVMMNIFASDSRLFKYPTWYKQTRMPVIGDIVLVLYKSKLKDSFKIAKIENVSSDGRNLDLIVSPYQDSSSSNFKIPMKMSVPTQRTILLYSPTDDGNEKCD